MEAFELPADFDHSCMSPTSSKIIESFCISQFVLSKVSIVLSGRLFHNTGAI